MIEAKHLAFYYEKQNAVDEVSISLPNGKITAILGPNGCGKSTLIKLLCGQLKPSRGEIILDDKPMRRYSQNGLAKTVSYLPQSRNLPEISVGALVLHGRFPHIGFPRVYGPSDRRIANKAMERTGVLELSGKMLSEISGGERQRTYVAMILAQNTNNILLDEPTTYLDITYQLDLFRFLSALKDDGKAIGVVLHDINMALQKADYIAVMKQGKILTAQSPKSAGILSAIEDAFEVKIRAADCLSFDQA